MRRLVLHLPLLVAGIVFLLFVVGGGGEGASSGALSEAAVREVLAPAETAEAQATPRAVEPSFRQELALAERRNDLGRAYRGEFRVGTPTDFVRYRGSGQFVVRGEGNSPGVTIDVDGGRFDFRYSGEGPLNLMHAGLSDLAEVLLAPDRILEADSENRIYFTWGEREVQVSVLSKETGEPLSSVDVFRVVAPERKHMDAGFGGALELGPEPGDEKVLSKASSPFTLSIEPGDSGQFWVVAEGAAPFQYRYPESLPRDVVSISLTTEGALEVWSEELLQDPSNYRLCLYRDPRGKGRPKDLNPLARFPVEAPTRIDSLGSGSYLVTLERIGDASPEGLVMASAQVALEPGQRRVLRLTASSPAELMNTGDVTFRFPEHAGEEITCTEVQVVPVSINARRLQRASELGPVPYTPGAEWGPLSLIPGEYYLLRSPSQTTHHFRVESQQSASFELPVLDLQPVFLTVLDSTTQEAIEPLSVSMATSMTWDGRFDGDHPHEVRSFRGGSSPTHLLAALGTSRICLQTVERGMDLMDIDVQVGRDPVIELDPPTRLGIRLEGLGDDLTLHWLGQARFFLNDRRIHPGSQQVGGSRGARTLGLLTFPEAGELSIDFPSLPASGTPRPMSTTLQPGELTWLTIDLQSFQE